MPGVAAPKRTPPPTWSPEAALVKRLGTTSTAGQFQLRPPKGYSLQRSKAGDRPKASAWVSAPREDGTRSFIMLVIAEPPAKEMSNYTPEQMLGEFLEGIQERSAKDWKRSPAERGTVNGLPFVRARWSGTSRDAPFRMRGVQYLTILEGKIITLSSQDVESDPKALQLAEASILTFKKNSTTRK